MSISENLIGTLAPTGLEIAPPQVCGAFRLVPLLRRHARSDLRLAQRSYQDTVQTVDVSGPLARPRTFYSTYIPHGLILSWSDDGSAVAAFGGSLGAEEPRFHSGRARIRLLPRLAKRMAGNTLRFLPLHLAMDGFLALHFGGPDIAWAEYSRRALRFGISPRIEEAYPGSTLAGFEDALRVFEIHDDQVGVLVFVADALASAFVVPSPADYRLLHPSLLEDFYGELIYQYGLLYHAAPRLETGIDEKGINSLSDLRAALAVMRADWAALQSGVMAADLLGRTLQAQ